MKPQRDPLSNHARVIDIRAVIQRRNEAERTARIERWRNRITYAVRGLGIAAAVLALCYFVWRGVWESFT